LEETKEQPGDAHSKGWSIEKSGNLTRGFIGNSRADNLTVQGYYASLLVLVELDPIDRFEVRFSAEQEKC